MADPNELRDFQELYAELQRQNRKTPEYQAFCDAIKAVNEKMSILYRKDRYGRIPLVTEA